MSVCWGAYVRGCRILYFSRAIYISEHITAVWLLARLNCYYPCCIGCCSEYPHVPSYPTHNIVAMTTTIANLLQLWC